MVSAAVIGIGATIMLLADLKEWRIVGIAGYFVLASSAVESLDPQGLTSVWNVLSVGFLLILPLSISLWCALMSESWPEDEFRMRFAPYARAALFASIVVASVPLTGFLIRSSRFATDVGMESEVMLLGFATAIMSIILLGTDSDKK